MAQKDTSAPYGLLGKKLRQLRESHRESVAEVSGAVEIEENFLTNIEAGKDRPSEDILLLLISHFGLEDDNAHLQSDQDDPRHRAAAMMIMLDPRVMYSDSVEVVSNQRGVIVNFAQTAGPDVPQLTISRIGMSYDQAKAVMGILHQVLYNRDNPGNARRLSDGSPKKTD